MKNNDFIGGERQQETRGRVDAAKNRNTVADKQLRDLIPFAELGSSVLRRRRHVRFTIAAMLRVAEKGGACVTAEDLAGCLGDLGERPDSSLLEVIKSNVSTAAAAAGLVFMHSAYESAVFDLIKRLVLYDPDPWVQFIDKKKIPFEMIRTASCAEVQKSLLSSWLKKNERQSFPWKVGKLFAVLQPGPTKDVIQGFEFNTEDFTKIDKLRHDLTHRPNFGTPIPDIYEKLSYLHKTVLLLQKLAEQKYPGPPKP